MFQIERLKLLLFLVKEAAINYHAAIWMPHSPAQVNSQSRCLLPSHFSLCIHGFEVCQIKAGITWVGTDFSVC